MTTVAEPQTIDAAELAEALRLDARSVRRRANREGWKSTELPANGGKKTAFIRAKLPAEVRAQLQTWQSFKAVDELRRAGEVQLLPPAMPLPVVPTAAHEETMAARATRDARDAVRRAVTRLAEETGSSTKAAIRLLLESAPESPPVAAMLRLAKDERGRKTVTGKASADPADKELPSVATIFRWLATQDLLPKRKHADMGVKPWMVLAYQLKARPQKPTTQSVHDHLLDAWDMAWGDPVSYRTLVRFFREKFSRMDILKGQHTGSALTPFRFFQHRSAAGLEPAVEVHADGWNTHFTAPHHRTGAFVTYEVWHFHDQATRYVTPVSIGYTETGEVILKGLENFIRELGVPRFLQTDSTGAVKNASVEFDPVSSLSKRTGMQIVHPVRVGNSQANGCPESFNRYLDHEARELATYQGKHQDSLTLKRVKKLTAKMVASAQSGDLATRDQLKAQAAKAGKGLVFSSHAEAVAWINARVTKFNDAPHRSLPKVTDPATGRKVHMTPRQALQAAKDAGWQPSTMDEASLVDLFRHHVRKTVSRETVSPYGGQRYYAPELADFNGEEVLVAVDRCDDARVWVKRLSGELICVADFVEATGYRSRTMNEIAEERRAAAQIRRREQQIDDIEERTQPLALDMEPGGIPLITVGGLSGLSAALDALKGPEPEPAPMPNSPEASAPAATVEPAPGQKAHKFNDPTDTALFLMGDRLEEEEAERAKARRSLSGAEAFMNMVQKRDRDEGAPLGEVAGS